MSEPRKLRTSGRSLRREFLTQSGALAGAALAGSLAIGRSAHAAGSDRLKIGLIGCGGRGAGAVVSALEVAPNARLTALADAFRDRMENARAQLKKRAGEQVTVDDGFIPVVADGVVTSSREKRAGRPRRMRGIRS
ncbi:MAG: hypothetical protein ABIP48_30075 [Planctomycetota bacterium]